jgi:hypothetical protein
MAKRKAKRSTFGVPATVGQTSGVSRALRVGQKQLAEANEVAQAMGCGAPFRADGMFEGTRTEKKRYMQELNRRRADQGEPRLVNFDGGHGDEI